MNIGARSNKRECYAHSHLLLQLANPFRLSQILPIGNPYKPFQTLPFLETALFLGGECVAKSLGSDLERATREKTCCQSRHPLEITEFHGN